MPAQSQTTFSRVLSQKSYLGGRTSIHSLQRPSLIDESPDKKMMDKSRLLLKKGKRKLNRLAMADTYSRPSYPVNWKEPEIISQTLSQYIRANGISRHGQGRVRQTSSEGIE